MKRILSLVSVLGLALVILSGCLKVDESTEIWQKLYGSVWTGQYSFVPEGSSEGESGQKTMNITLEFSADANNCMVGTVIENEPGTKKNRLCSVDMLGSDSKVTKTCYFVIYAEKTQLEDSYRINATFDGEHLVLTVPELPTRGVAVNRTSL